MRRRRTAHSGGEDRRHCSRVAPRLDGRSPSAAKRAAEPPRLGVLRTRPAPPAVVLVAGIIGALGNKKPGSRPGSGFRAAPLGVVELGGRLVVHRPLRLNAPPSPCAPACAFAPREKNIGPCNERAYKVII